VEEGWHVYELGSGEIHIWVKCDTMREVLYQIVNQAHVIVGIRTGKLYLIATKNLVMGEVDPEIKGNAEK